MLLELAELKSDIAIRSSWGGETHAKKACRVLRYLPLRSKGAPISVGQVAALSTSSRMLGLVACEF